MVFFQRTKDAITSPNCDVNNLVLLSKDIDNGQNPFKMSKRFYGQKNTSPYCKQLNMNFDSLSQYKKDIEAYYGDETDVSKIKQIMNEPVSPPKPWYKF
jgi:hypothetical protein